MSGVQKKAKKPRYGILGVKKTDRIFFSAAGEDWSSDSEDDDYHPPGEDEIVEINTKKRKQERRKKQAIIKEEKKKGKIDIKLKQGITTWHLLPPEILVKILKFCSMNEGHLRLDVLGTVCNDWKRVARTESLWKYVDLARGSEMLNKKDLESTSKKLYPLMRKTERIVLNKSITMSQFTNLIRNFQEIREISFKGCSKLKPELLTEIAESGNLKNLQGVDFNGTFQDFIGLKDMFVFINNILPNLTKLVLSNNKFNKKTITAIFQKVASDCTKLKIFELENCHSSAIPQLDYLSMCKNCRSLRVLNFNDTLFHPFNSSGNSQNDETTYKLNLEEFRMSQFLHVNIYVSPSFITDFIGMCDNLTLLDVNHLRNCNSFNFLLKLHAQKLKHLYLSNTFTKNLVDDLEMELQVRQVFSRWGPSLLDLDLSKNLLPSTVWDAIFDSFGPNPSLITLNLESSNIAIDTLDYIMKTFHKLRYVNISLCRTIRERGIKREYQAEEINILRSKFYS
ncbi:unnamed protein product [Dimorphilus gyrociliatus]|uniref:F-box domain-containing protein n=1 Tax=Dimorphilus gyrociliatus TaxID=2664684 RepID=A0A7I8W181_9ANNE|nr:unnamed protein product [Dimorphilus gyrociliatus]